MSRYLAAAIQMDTQDDREENFRTLEKLIAQAAEQGAKLICMGAANMTPYEDYHFVYMHTRAMENRIYTLYCNYVGTEKRFHYCGQSGAFHPTGKILAQADPRSEALLLADIDLADTTAQDDFLNYLRHRQTQVYHPDLLG